MILFLVILFSGIVPGKVHAQSMDSILLKAEETEGDSAYVKYLHDIIWASRHENRKLAFQLLDHMENWYEDTGIDFRRDANVYYYALLYKYDADYSKSAEMFIKYLDFQIQKKDSMRIGAVYNGMSNLYYDQSIFDSSMYYTTLAMGIYDQIGDTSTYVNMLTRKGMLLVEVDRLEEALEDQKMAMELGKGVAPPHIFANVINNTALVFEAMEEYDSTTYYYQKYLDYAIENDLKRSIYYAEYNLATHLMKKKKYDQSLKLLQSAYSRANTQDDPNMKNFILIGLAELYNNSGQPAKALEQIELIDQDVSTIEHQKEINEKAYRAYKKLNNLSKALEHHEKYKLYTDSMLNESMSQQIQEIEARYETEKKEEKIQNLQLVQAANEKRILYQWGIILISILGLGMLGLFIYQLKSKNRVIASNNKIIQKNLEQKELLLQEIHHRVKNNLQVVSSLLRLQTRSTSGSAANALAGSESRVRSMALIHQHLYQGEDFTSVHMATYLKDLAQQVVSAHSLNNEKIKLELNISEDIYLDVNTVVPIGLVTNEWLTNSCKYAFSGRETGHIYLSLQPIDKTNYVLEIKDDGIGYNSGQDENEGFGTRLVRAFANRVQGKLSILQDDGTTCRLEFPKANES